MPVLLQVLSDAEWVEGLVIRYRADAGPFRSLSIHSSGGGSYIVAGLRKFARYQLFVVPFFQTVYGRPSNSRTVRTLQDGGWEADSVFLTQTALCMVNRQSPFNYFVMSTKFCLIVSCFVFTFLI